MLNFFLYVYFKLFSSNLRKFYLLSKIYWSYYVIFSMINTFNSLYSYLHQLNILLATEYLHKLFFMKIGFKNTHGSKGAVRLTYHLFNFVKFLGFYKHNIFFDKFYGFINNFLLFKLTNTFRFFLFCFNFFFFFIICIFFIYKIKL